MRKLLSEMQLLCTIHLDMVSANTTVDNCLPDMASFCVALCVVTLAKGHDLYNVNHTCWNFTACTIYP